MERCRQTCNQEKSVEIFLSEKKNEKVTNMMDILKNINSKQDESAFYYAGGLRALCTISNDSKYDKN